MLALVKRMVSIMIDDMLAVRDLKPSPCVGETWVVGRWLGEHGVLFFGCYRQCVACLYKLCDLGELCVAHQWVYWKSARSHIFEVHQAVFRAVKGGVPCSYNIRFLLRLFVFNLAIHSVRTATPVKLLP